MPPPRPLSVKKKLLFSLLALALVLLGLEGLARAYEWLKALGQTPPAPAVVRRFHPLRYELRPGATLPANGASASVNSLGLRGPEPPPDGARLRVLCLGDSCTFGYAPDVTDEMTYPEQLARRLEASEPARFSVLNGGMPGFGSLDCLALLVDRGEAIEPDVVVILAGWNDNYRVQDLGEPPPAPWWSSLERNSAFVRLMAVAIRRVLARMPVDETGWLRRQARQLPRRNDALADSGFARTRRALEAMVAIARDAGAEPVLVTYPNFARRQWTESTDSLTDDELRRMLPHLAVRRLSPAGWYRYCTRINAEIASVARSRRVPLVDGASIRSPRLFVDACHLTAEGNAALARLVEPAVRRAVSARASAALGADPPR